MIGIHVDRCNISTDFTSRYTQILEYNNIPYCILDSSTASFWETITKLELFIFRWHHTDYHHQLAKSIIPIVEFEYGIKCFPDWKTCWHFDDKIIQYYLLKKHGFPVVETFVFWDKDSAMQWVEIAEFPVVFKLKGGAGSANVVLVEDKARASDLIRQMFTKGFFSGGILPYYKRGANLLGSAKSILKKAAMRAMCHTDYYSSWNKHQNYVLFQRFLPRNTFDTRVTVIGARAFAFRRFCKGSDFRASGTGIHCYDPSDIDIRTVSMAFEVSKTLGFQSMCYDFLCNTDGEIQICEMSYTSKGVGVFNCPGYWDVDLKWHSGHYWPEYLHLVDSLGDAGLKPLDLKIV